MGIYEVNIRIQSERRKVRTRKTSIIIFTEKDIEKVRQNLDSNKALRLIWRASQSYL